MASWRKKRPMMGERTGMMVVYTDTTVVEVCPAAHDNKEYPTAIANNFDYFKVIFLILLYVW